MLFKNRRFLSNRQFKKNGAFLKKVSFYFIFKRVVLQYIKDLTSCNADLKINDFDDELKTHSEHVRYDKMILNNNFCQLLVDVYHLKCNPGFGLKNEPLKLK